MRAITVKEYSELYGISVRTLNDQIQKGKLPEGVIKTISAGSGRTCAKLLVMSEEKKIPKKVGVFLG